MARFNEILVGRYNRFLQKLLSMKGPASVPQLAAELQPVIQVFNGVETRSLEGWNRYGLYMIVVAGAATASLIRFRNPAGSNLVAVLEKVTVSNLTGATQQYNIRHGSGDASDAAVLQSRSAAQRWDNRQGGNATSLVISSNSGSVATPPSPGGTKVIGVLTANLFMDFIQLEDQQMLILPGDSLDIFENGVAVTLDVAFTWRERFLEDSERQ